MGDMKKLLENWREYETGALNELDGSGLGPKAKKTNWEKVSADRERQKAESENQLRIVQNQLEFLGKMTEEERSGLWDAYNVPDEERLTGDEISQNLNFLNQNWFQKWIFDYKNPTMTDVALTALMFVPYGYLGKAGRVGQIGSRMAKLADAGRRGGAASKNLWKTISPWTTKASIMKKGDTAFSGLSRVAANSDEAITAGRNVMGFQGGASLPMSALRTNSVIKVGANGAVATEATAVTARVISTSATYVPNAIPVMTKSVNYALGSSGAKAAQGFRPNYTIKWLRLNPADYAAVAKASPELKQSIDAVTMLSKATGRGGPAWGKLAKTNQILVKPAANVAGKYLSGGFAQGRPGLRSGFAPGGKWPLQLNIGPAGTLLFRKPMPFQGADLPSELTTDPLPFPGMTTPLGGMGYSPLRDNNGNVLQMAPDGRVYAWDETDKIEMPAAIDEKDLEKLQPLVDQAISQRRNQTYNPMANLLDTTNYLTTLDDVSVSNLSANLFGQDFDATDLDLEPYEAPVKSTPTPTPATAPKTKQEPAPSRRSRTGFNWEK
tara:strand:+ start:681 stop:2336 length:1656 start_codon:yes stop_codon:yes gene_type:complete